jgi:hypothetical protein
LKIYDELDPDKKDAKWANQVINKLRMDWRPLVNLLRSRENKAYLFGNQSMDKIKKSFKDKAFLKSTDFQQIDVIFNPRQRQNLRLPTLRLSATGRKTFRC